MEITEVRVKLMSDQDDRLKAFCSITLDHQFVVRDIKIIRRQDGLFVAMPSRKIAAHCPSCRVKNSVQSRFCNGCGQRLPPHDPTSQKKLFADVAHPVNPQCRAEMQARILAEYQDELLRSQQPGYQPRYDDEGELEL